MELEFALLLRGLKKYLADVDAPRAFALDHTAKKLNINLSRTQPEFKNDGENVFDVVGTRVDPDSPKDADALTEGDIFLMSKVSGLDDDELNHSYKAYKKNIRIQEEAARAAAERQTLGADYDLQGPWKGKFGSREKMLDAFGDNLRVHSSAAKLAPTWKIISMDRKRECELDATKEDISKFSADKLLELARLEFTAKTRREFLAPKVSGPSRRFPKTVFPCARLCGTRGDNFPNVIPQYSVILQPVYVGSLPKNLHGDNNVSWEFPRRNPNKN